MTNRNKWKKRIKMSLAVLMGIGVLFANCASVFANETPTAQVGEVAEIPVLKESYIDLSNINFSVPDIRDTSKVRQFNGGDGRQAVIIFGSANCSNTMSALKTITQISEKADLSNLNIYMFEVKSDSDVSDDILISKTADITDRVTINRTSADSKYYQLYSNCFWKTVNSGYTMPLVIYKGTDGQVYEYTTGSGGISLDAILGNIAKGGLVIEIPALTLNIEGKEIYSQAYKVLELLNEEREKEGLTPLVMDKDLLDAGMLRAAECAVYYSHTRPYGESCFTASNKMHGENIAIGYLSAEQVMNGWMNSPGHKANILKESYKSVGVGCFFNGQVYTWVQCFGSGEGTKGDQKEDAVKSYTLKAISDNVDIILEEETFTLNVGSTMQLSLYTVNQTFPYTSTNVKPDSYRWSSDSDAVSVDENGVITAKKAGEAVITGVNKGDDSNTLIATATVNPEPEPEPEPEPKEDVIDLFEDIKEGQWWVNAVQYAYDNNIMSGKGSKFEPAATLKREEFAQVLYNHSGKPGVNIQNNFPDVKDTWYKNAVLWANENNIANGYKTGKFGIGDNISRQDLALMLYKYAVLKGYDTTAMNGLILLYADGDKVSYYAQNAMNWAITQGIMSGKGNKGEDIYTFKLDPTGTATRAECASMMMKLLEKNK